MPAGIAGGHVVCLQGYVFPQTCEIQCEAGFEHSGVTSVTCTSSGVWTDGDPCVGEIAVIIQSYAMLNGLLFLPRLQH